MPACGNYAISRLAGSLEIRFLDAFSGMVAPLESLERQGLGPVGPKTQAFNEVEWRVQPFLDPMDPLKTSRKPRNQ